MKKFKRLFFVFVVMFLSFVVVNAEEKMNYLEYDWSFKQGQAANYLYYDATVEVEDGYITTSFTNQFHGVIRKISKDGTKILWEVPETYGLFYGLATDGEFIYALYMDTAINYGDTYLFKYDLDGNRLTYVFLERDDTYDGEVWYHPDDDKIYVMNRGNIKNVANNTSGDEYGAKHLYTITSTDDTFVVDKVESYWDVDPEEINRLTGNSEGLMSNGYKNIYPEEVEYFWYSNVLTLGDYKYIVGEVFNDDKYTGVLIKVDNKGEIVWLKKDDLDNSHYFDVTTNGKYLVVAGYVGEEAIGYQKNQNQVVSFLKVFDEAGNLLEEHDIAEEMGVERTDITHMMTFGNEIVGQAFAKDTNGNLQSYVFKYKMNYVIETKVVGEGIVDVNSYAKDGDEIVFTVTPEKGYEIDVIKVTDELGNVVEFTDSKFVMPSSNVTIEVIFKEIINNPNTGLKNPYIICSTMLICGTLSILFLKKKKYI